MRIAREVRRRATDRHLFDESIAFDHENGIGCRACGVDAPGRFVRRQRVQLERERNRRDDLMCLRVDDIHVVVRVIRRVEPPRVFVERERVRFDADRNLGKRGHVARVDDGDGIGKRVGNVDARAIAIDDRAARVAANFHARARRARDRVECGQKTCVRRCVIHRGEQTIVRRVGGKRVITSFRIENARHAQVGRIDDAKLVEQRGVKPAMSRIADEVDDAEGVGYRNAGLRLKRRRVERENDAFGVQADEQAIIDERERARLFADARREHHLIVRDDADCLVGAIRHINALARRIDRKFGGLFAGRHEFDDAVVLNDRDIIRAGVGDVHLAVEPNARDRRAPRARQFVYDDAVADGERGECRRGIGRGGLNDARGRGDGQGQSCGAGRCDDLR